MAQLKTKILLLNGSQQDWLDLKDHVLSPGEPAVEFVPNIGSQEHPIEAVKIKVGDGFTTYENLPYIGEHLVNEFTTKFNELETAIAASGNAVFQITGTDLATIEGVSEGDKIANYISTVLKKTVNEGNIAIVTKEIADGTLSYTAYVYTSSKVWAAMDGNYSAENVYFNNDFTYTANIGALTLANGKTSGTYSAKGKSLIEVLDGIMSKTLLPTIAQPKFTLSAAASSNTSAASKEIGSYISELSWTGTFTDGTYSFGFNGGTGTNNKNAGCTATYEVSCDKAGTAYTTTSNRTGTWTLTDNIQIDSTDEKTYATITNKCTWSDSPREPIDNKGNVVAGKITSSYKEEKANVKVTGYRNSFYYVGTDCTTPIDNAFVRSATPRNANTVNFNIDSTTPGGATFSGVVIPANTTRVMFAVPGVRNNIAVINVDGMGLPEDGFNKTVVRVKGANNFVSAAAQEIANTNTDALENEDGYLYTVFTKENVNGMAATGFAITIS